MSGHPEVVIGAYIDCSDRGIVSDVEARPRRPADLHHKRESPRRAPDDLLAALAVGRLGEDRTGRSLRKFVRTTAATAPSISAQDATF